MESQDFNIHGTHLRVAFDHPSMRAGIADLLGFFRFTPPSSPANCSISMHRLSRNDDRPCDIPPGFKHIPYPGWPGAPLPPGTEAELNFFVRPGHILADLGPLGWIALDLARGLADEFLVRPEEQPPEVIASLLLFAVGGLMRSQGKYLLHASALEKNGKGVLFVGTGGSGKTTCCLSLLRAGYQFISDDHPFLQQRGDEVIALAFPEDIHLTNETISHFADLQNQRQFMRQGFRKLNFDPQAVYRIAQSCQPAILIFPKITGLPQSQLEVLPRACALERLLPQSSLTLAQEKTQDQLNTLSRLVSQSACYQLHFGQDILDLPSIIDKLLG